MNYAAVMLVPAVCYLIYSGGLNFSDSKPWTAAAWLCYSIANVCFYMANVNGE